MTCLIKTHAPVVISLTIYNNVPAEGSSQAPDHSCPEQSSTGR